ncbi:alpha/beta hydrolase fold domain-containing protein [Tenggerimyces flavus]|uniref:Alpha/beta hydrolase fold domain-containing protein n=2 Tax=Tenggerimyces flavus TaxID=1708749 RepID=A0ABV7YDN9_9ACTN
MEDNVLRLPASAEAIEVRHLRAFVAVAEELNFGRAATRLYVTQPALSRQIGGLERLVGCQLLRRSTRSVELTLPGEVLLTRAKDLLHDLHEAVTMTRSVGDELEERAARIWAPVSDLAASSAGLDELRAAYESVSAMFPVPEGIVVRPANTGGVVGLSVSPDPEQPATVLFLHGGGMALGSAYGYRSLAGALAAAAGATVVIPDFRLAPEHPFPAALDDAVSAYEWMLSRGVPPRTISVATDSMGAHLTLSMVLKLRDDGVPLPGRLVLMSPGVEFTPPDQVDRGAAEVIRGFGAAYLGDRPANDPLVHPLLADFTGLPELFVQAGTQDLMYAQAADLIAHARAHGVKVVVDDYPLAAHVFQLFWPFLPEAATALEKAGDYIRAGAHR